MDQQVVGLANRIDKARNDLADLFYRDRAIPVPVREMLRSEMDDARILFVQLASERYPDAARLPERCARLVWGVEQVVKAGLQGEAITSGLVMRITAAAALEKRL